MKCRVAVLALLLPWTLTSLQAADLKLAAVFSDHMVLQRDKPIPIWGWARPGEKITVDFDGRNKTATAGANGKWLVKLDPLPASAAPHTLTARAESQNHPVEIHDILVGEVWLGSGQSNMVVPVQSAINFETEKAAANLPLIRLFKEESNGAETEQPDAHGKWVICSPDTVGPFAAALFFFGRDLHRALNVPVGLINSAVGSTPIESWIAGDKQANTPSLQADFAAAQKTYLAFDPAKASESELLLHTRRGAPGSLFNAKIAPLIPFAIRGVIWYQGEANSQPGLGPLYRDQLPLLVNDWRARWGEELPFGWFQLPNFDRKGDGWMLVREAMLQSLRLPHTGMAITVDIGESKNIHPKNKQEAARRMALWALADVYGEKVPSSSGPLPAGHTLSGSEIVLSFTHADAGLVAKDGPLKGFVIAGEDRQWKPANARIEGDKVIVSAAGIPKPLAVRYAWESDPACNLYNGAGLPASPFRTDSW